jgi:hypothetical protein
MSDTDEMKMTGLILAQSALVGIAVGVFSAGLWLPTGSDSDSTINGMTYAMGALAVQTIAYYIFKMFFEQGMKEKVQIAEMQRQRSEQFRSQQMGFDQRRMDLELRVQEMQLENELRMLQADPSRITSNFNGAAVSGTGVDYHNTFNPGIPLHNAENEKPLNLGMNKTSDETQKEIPRKKDGSPDLRYKAKRGGN